MAKKKRSKANTDPPTPRSRGFKSLDPKTAFELEEKIGKGSYGEVYRAKDVKSGGIFAMKTISLEHEDSALDIKDQIDSFQKCSHKNIVDYLACYIVEQSLWILMEFCSGGSVGSILQVLESGIEEDSIAFICREVLKGLKYLHSQQKLHRDIKGSNILLTEDGDVKLTDFGISGHLLTAFSRRNTFVGSPYWTAPEVIQNTHSSFDTSADVWSIGITLIEMAESVPPNSNVHPMRVLFVIPKEPPPKLSNDKKWYLIIYLSHPRSSQFRDFLSKCLVKDPAKREGVKELLKHKFVRDCKTKQVLVEIIEKSKKVIQERGFSDSGSSDDEGSTFDDSSSESSATSANSTGTFVDYGTMVHHQEQSGTFVEHKSDRPSRSAKAFPPRYTQRHSDHYEQIRSIYRRSEMSRLPFLNLNSISPLSLTEREENSLQETLDDLTGAETKLSVDALMSKTTMGNLLRALDYHKDQQLNEPMTPVEVEQNARAVRDLTTTLKTILRL